ncbi:cytochrome P450 family protein [Streptomyces tubercidicus]|uniref:cytochrome P450 family protein n=1 Tax=Streptomyces tubercidicus TaxID=47759 RepID=UPI003466E956
MLSRKPVPMSGCPYKTDPYPQYEKMRQEGSVHPVLFPSGVQAWLVTGYEAAHRALNDRRLGKNHDLGNEGWRSRAAIMPEPQHSQLQAHLLHQDAPDHGRMRKLVLDSFTPRRAEALRPRIQQLADALIDALPADSDPDGVDLVASFAAHFPFQVLSEAIGLPPELADAFDRDWGKVVQPVGPTDPGRPRYEARLRGLQTYISEVVAHTRAHPGDHLLGRLVAAKDNDTLSGDELGSMIFQLLVAGQEPVTNQITTALVTLLRHPDALRRLRDEPELLPQAVEELLRYDSAFELTTWRFFAEDSDLYGTRIPAGDSVIISLCAANRDPAHFPHAERLDLQRSPNPHLAFGHGSHFCPGAALARTELAVALGTLLARLPGLRLAVPDEDLDWVQAVLARGVTELPVHYDLRR